MRLRRGSIIIMGNKKNLRRVSLVINSQTLWHLKKLAAEAGYSDRELGRIVDKLVRERAAERSEY